VAALGIALFALATPRPDPVRLRYEIRSAIDVRNWDQAARALAQLRLPRDPLPPDLLLRARIHSGQGRDDEALSDLARIPDDDPNAQEARLLEASIELKRLRLRPAESAFQCALKQNPRLPRALWGLAMIYTLQMRRAEVLDAFDALAREVPLSFEQALVWTQVRCSSWDLTKVVPQLRRSLEADPSDRRVRLALAEALRQLGQAEESQRVLEPLAATDPDALVIRAWHALDDGDEASARKLLDAGPPDHPDLAHLRGRIALLRRDGPTAVAQFRAALEASPDRRESLSGLAQALRLVGKNEEAEAISDTVRRLDSLTALVQTATERTRRDDPTLLRDLGAACQSLGLLPEARAWYVLAISRDPTNSEAQAALHRLSAPTRK
jgi:tetratricopeptide (TPR) repeat protein